MAIWLVVTDSVMCPIIMSKPTKIPMATVPSSEKLAGDSPSAARLIISETICCDSTTFVIKTRLIETMCWAPTSTSGQKNIRLSSNHQISKLVAQR